MITRLGAGLASLVTVAGCFGPSPDEHRSRLSLSLNAGGRSGLLSNHVASVIGSARLTISAEGRTSTETITLSPTDTSSEFEIRAPSGAVRFTAEVLSTNQTVLIRGDTTVQVDRNGFAVTLRPVFVAPLLAIAPNNPASVVTQDNGQQRFYRVRWALANFGSDTLKWRIDQAATPGASSCVFNDNDCFRDRPVASRTAGFVDLFYVGPTSAPRGMTRPVVFRSNVGDLATTAQDPP